MWLEHWQESCLHAAESSFGRLLQPLRSTDTTTVTISSENCCVEKRKALLQQRGRQALHRHKAYLQAGKVPSEWPGAAHTVRAEERRLLIDSHGRRTKCKETKFVGQAFFFLAQIAENTTLPASVPRKKTRELSRTADSLLYCYAGGSLFCNPPILIFILASRGL